MLSNKIVSSNQIHWNSGGVVLGDAINYAQNIGHVSTVRWALISRPLKNAPFCPIPALGSNFNLRNTRCMSVVKIFACLPLKVRDFRIGLAPRLNFKKFNGAGKIEHLSKVSPRFLKNNTPFSASSGS